MLFFHLSLRISENDTIRTRTQGIDYYTSEEAVAASADKPYFESLSGKTLKDNLTMLTIVSNVKGVDAIELNVACPNVIGHPIIGYDFDQFQDVLESLASHPMLVRNHLVSNFHLILIAT